MVDAGGFEGPYNGFSKMGQPPTPRMTPWHGSNSGFLGDSSAAGRTLSGPPHSPDLNPPDFYLWGYLKDNVYANHPQTIPELKDSIAAAVNAISKEECRRVIENFARRVQVCLQRQGAHLEHIL